MVQTPAKLDTETLLIQMPRTLELDVTPEQFEVLAVTNRELRLERTAQGKLIVNPPTGGTTGKRNSKIIYFLNRWIEEEGGHGESFDSSTGFELPNGANRSPDAAWVQQARWNALTPEQQDDFIPLCPDFVVELRSKTDTLKGLRAKMSEYITNGAQLGWLIDPKNKQVEIYCPGQAVEVLENPQTLSGEEILPGFSLNLQRIW